MCGIAGFHGLKKNGLINQMSRSMAHRGPDGEGFYISDSVSLVNRRLAVIDRSGGDQPIYNEDRSLTVVYNGEIYNYQKLRQELEKSGHIFKTNSDTEVIVHGYEEWGYDVFDKFDGMFALALYDIKKDTLILVRDQFGIKPLYYFEGTHKKQNFFIFSSEIKPLLDTDLIVPTVNEKILYRYLKFRIHDDLPDTFFAGIKRVQPGQMIVLHQGHKEMIQYCNLSSDLIKQPLRGNKNEQEITDEFLSLLSDSVKKRLVSEVPVGSALSGGIDSSTIVALVNQYINQNEAKAVGTKQNTFSAVFPGLSNDEEIYIDTMLKTTKNIKSYKIFPKSKEFFAEIEEFVRTQEEPTISTGPYAQYKVMETAKNYVTVLLDGQGADEMMAGYLPYYFVYFNQLYKEKQFIKIISEIWSARDVFIRYAILRMQQLIYSSHQVNIDTLLHTNFVQEYKDERFTTNRNHLKKRLCEDIFRNSLPALLRYEDRNTMRFSLEGRVPYLNKKLISFIFSLPDKFIISHGWNKYILRKSTKDLLPEKIRLRRNKIGFTTPEYEWFLQSKEHIYKIFLSESFANRPYWDAQKVLKAFRLFLQNKNDDTMVFWRLINTELWLREFIDEKRIVDPSHQKNTTHTTSDWQLGTPNEGKKIEIKVGDTTYSRVPIRTERFEKGDNYTQKIAQFVSRSINALGIQIDPASNLKNQKSTHLKWYVIVSEKIVAISQGRSFFIWDINPTWWANILSSFVSRTPYGIGLGSPWTMQIAIDEVGLPRILLAAVASVVTKPFGIKGVFYRVAGPQAAAIDGPTEYSLFPSNVSAKLAPKNPKQAAEKIKEAVTRQLTVDGNKRSLSSNFQLPTSNFGGVVIIDANDLGRNVMGNATDQPDSFFEEVMRDNPMGQGSEQTPLVIVT